MVPKREMQPWGLLLYVLVFSEWGKEQMDLEDESLERKSDDTGRKSREDCGKYPERGAMHWSQGLV